MKKITFLTLIAMAALSAFLFACKGGFSRTLTFTRNEIQNKVEEKFPIKRSQMVVTLVLTDPNVVLEEGSNQIGLKADAEAKLPGSGLGSLIGIGHDSYKGTVYIEGDVEYDPVEGTFYFIKGKIKEISIEGFPEQIKKPVSEMANIAVGNNLARVPLFTLNEKDMKERAARFFLKSAKVRNGKLEVVVGL